ncbi:hypothetical protein ACLOJK_009245 [Asimina triloba]
MAFHENHPRNNSPQRIDHESNPPQGNPAPVNELHRDPESENSGNGGAAGPSRNPRKRKQGPTLHKRLTHHRIERLPRKEQDIKDANAFHQQHPPSFSGGDSTEAENWLLAINKILEFLDCPDRQKVLFATFKLARRNATDDTGIIWDAATSNRGLVISVEKPDTDQRTALVE